MIYNQWYAVLSSKELGKNAMIGVKRLGLSLVFFRTSSDEIGCLEDKCSHRGTRLSIGKHHGSDISCPFHGLQFDTNGKCTFIPANGKVSKENLERFNVEKYSVVEKNEIIYIWYGDESKKTDNVPFFYDNILEDTCFSETTDYWNAHYSRVIENQLDVVHLPFVHHNTIGRGNKTIVNGPKVVLEKNSIITSANNEKDMGQTPKPASECEIGKYYLHFIFPNIWMNFISKKAQVVIFFAPVDEENTKLYLRFYSKMSKIGIVNRMISFFGKIGNRIIERQDKRVVITQIPKASSLKSGEVLLAGDAPIIQYRKMRSDLSAETEMTSQSFK